MMGGNGGTAAEVLAGRLERYAETAVRVGVNVQPGQELIVTASLDAVPLARAISRHAYAAGAGLVTTLYDDDEDTLARFAHAGDASFDLAPTWMYDGMAAAYRTGAARLAVRGANPDLLSGQDPERVARANRARSLAMKPALEPIANFDTNWSIVTFASPAWARAVFPDLPEGEAVARLWDAILDASRIDDDPVANWRRHDEALLARTRELDGRRFSALRFRGPGTDLTVGLADGHAWCGGATVARNGVTCNANIPTEEVFTTPHRLRVEGHVSSTRPLSYQGTLIDGIRVTFSEGRIVEASAERGEAVLARMIDTDEGASRLGEVALVPASSPIAASGLLFSNTLFDENAASHIALGQSYAKCFADGGGEPDALHGRGANTSLIHVDWMIGSAMVDVDGIAQDGTVEPVMRAGEWA